MGKREPYTEAQKEQHNLEADIATLREPPRFVWRHQYDAARDEMEGDLVAQDFPEPSLTQQHFAHDADLNVIVKRYGITDGSIPVAPLDPRFFGDFTNAPEDLRQVLDISRQAKDMFMALPAEIRTQFQNDPALLHDWVTNPANRDEAIKMKLVEPDPPKKDTRPPRVKAAAEYTDWIKDPKNREEADRLGLKETREKPASK